MPEGLMDWDLAVARGQRMREVKRIFLTAEWRDLAMLNYEVDPSLLERYVPQGTDLDSFERKTYVSLVGFCFSRTRLWGKIAVPLHTEFEEVNLRFYVRRREGSEKRRGVCFIAEIVPKRAIAWTARLVYGENYRRFPMEHRVAQNGLGKTAEYGWRVGDRSCRLFVHAGDEPGYPREGSLEQFITEHYWGYSKQRSGGSLEYRVAHAPWRVALAASSGFAGDATTYGAAFAEILCGKPDSAFLAEGSSVEVFAGERIG
jgi:uncharacterized protein YqjF (DUF2071 family)